MSLINVLRTGPEWAVVEKPSGILMHRSEIAPDRETLVDLLKAQTGRDIYCVHRLDRQTSGVCLVAFNAETTALLQKVFARRQVEKNYLALVRGSFPDTLTVERPLTGDDGKKREASTEFGCVHRFRSCSLIRANPLTGRRHQIRRHLAHQMHHIIGDTTYGKGGINREFREKYNLHRLFLHAERLKFTCPRSEAEVEVRSVLPEGLAAVVSLLTSEQ
jgi:tRNA pseudouridine65 synthase